MVSVFQDELQARISFKALFLQTIKQLNYFSERFLSSRGAKMSNDFLRSLMAQVN